MSYNLGRIGFNLRGAYDAAANYERLDVVNYNGSSYAAIDESIGVVPTNAEHWMLLSQGFEDVPTAHVPTLSAGSSSASTNGNGRIRWRKAGKHIYISGGISATYAGSNLVLFTLPEGARPAYKTLYFMRACSGSRLARVGVSTNGNVFINWVKNISDASNYTSAAVWIDCNFDFWVD